MYVPLHALEENADTLRSAIEEIGFGTLATVRGGEPLLTHLPMRFAQGAGRGRIVGQLARANGQWQQANSTFAVAAFIGPHFYVSPNVYETQRKTGKVVPTWNYIAVQARGRITFFDDRERLLALVESLTDQHEARSVAPWAVADAPQDYIDAQLQRIVGFELAIDELVGAWKLGRNRNQVDRSGLAEAMAADPQAAVRNLAPLVRDTTVSSH